MVLPRAGKNSAILVAYHLGAGIDLFDHVGLEGRRRQNLAQDLQAFDIGGAVDFGREIVDPNFRRRRRIGASDAERARLSGRNWQTEAVKPENACSFSPILSVENGRK